MQITKLEEIRILQEIRRTLRKERNLLPEQHQNKHQQIQQKLNTLTKGIDHLISKYEPLRRIHQH